MGIEIGRHPDEDRLDLTIEGNLDLTLTAEVLQVCELVDRRLQLCVIDSTRITRVFDSGIGLMLLLIDRLKAAGVELIVIGEIPGLAPHLRLTSAESRCQPGDQPALDYRAVTMPEPAAAKQAVGQAAQPCLVAAAFSPRRAKHDCW